MALLYKNIALLQLNIQQGIDEYYLAKNVDWQGRKIDKIILFAPKTSGMLSPIDGVTPVLTDAYIDSMYFDLYDTQDHTLCNGLSAECIKHTNNHPFAINSHLQFSLCRAYFSSVPQVDGCVLLYVIYDAQEDPNCEVPEKSITIQFPMQANEIMSFTRLINTYLHAPNQKVKGVSFWQADANPAYITLRDHEDTYIIHDLATPLMRPQMAGADAESTQVYPMRFDNIDIDFDNSYIRNATGSACVQTIEIKY